MTATDAGRDPSLPERPAIAGSPLSVVLPVYNATPLLQAILDEWTTLLDRLGRDYEILLVDDGSTDGTEAQADAQAKVRPRLRVLRHAQRRGFGSALRTGIDEARHPLLCYTSCDRQYRPEDLSRLLGTIDKVDVVTGIRLWQPVPRWLWVLHSLWRGLVRILFGAAPAALSCWLGWRGFGRRLVARWVFGVRVQDPECAFRLFRRSLFARMPIQSDDALAHVEILAKANFLGAWIAEEPVSYAPPERPTESVDFAGGGRFQAEAWHLFKEPDFGPPLLPPAAENSDRVSPPLAP